MIKKLFDWIFKSELDKLRSEISKAQSIAIELTETKRAFDSVLGNIDVSVDVHEYDKYSPSWAVISLQGQKSDYLKFIKLNDCDINQISQFLRRFERINNIKIDATPMATEFFRVNRGSRP